MSNPLAFRPADAGDADAVLALIREAYALYLPRMDREPAPMTADYAALIAQGTVTLAHAGEALVGALICYPRGDHLHVETVAVAAAAQGQGVGRALMAHAEELARERGLSAIELYTNAVMTENLPFYAALGYDITGRGEEDGFDRIFFCKALPSTTGGSDS